MLEPFIDCDDIADVAPRLATTPVRKDYELCGPRLLGFAGVAQALQASGRRSATSRSRSGYAALLDPIFARSGDVFIDLFRYLLDGHNAHVTDGVRGLSRPARLASYAQAWAA
jgi:uncharacterized protein YbjT (DUF2867 family)